MKKGRLGIRTGVSIQIIPFHLLAFFYLLTSPEASAQQLLDRKISCAIRDVEIRDALQHIESVAHVKFVFSSTAIPVQQKISVIADQRKLSDVLNDMLSPFGIKYDIVDGRILLYKDSIQMYPYAAGEKLNAERWMDHTVTGMVNDITGEPLVGVNILVKGTNRGTRVNSDGSYSIRAEEKDILIFSFIGFKPQEFTVGTQKNITVRLEPDISILNEVIVTGYNEVPKESFTGSTVAVAGPELKTVNPVNLLQSLQTFDPSFQVLQNNTFGSNPNYLPDINVRGTTALPATESVLLNKNNFSLNPNLPTFILDGFQVSLQTVYDLDVNRIESATFLKDAAAAALYGSRAANGVLVIKTKVPDQGRLQGYYNYNFSITAPDLTVYSVLNAHEKMEYEQLAGVYDSQSQYGAQQDQHALDELYYSKWKNVVSGVDTYWLAEPVQTAYDHNHSIGIHGGSSSVRYALTARYQNLNGVMKGSYRNRYGADLRIIYTPNEKLSISNTCSVMEVQAQESPYGNFADYVRMNPYYKKTDGHGNPLREIDTILYYDNTPRKKFVLSPLYDATLASFDKSEYTLLIDEVVVNWNINSNWMMRGVISYQHNQAAHDKYKSPWRNEYYSKDLSSRGEYRAGHTNENIVDGNMLLAFHKSIRNHFVNASLGANLRAASISSEGFTATGFVNDRFDPAALDKAYRQNDFRAGSVYEERLAGAFLTINYSYANRYLLDIVGRVDGSSKFGTENKTAPFWSAGVGWNIHNEEMLSSVKAINLLRITATTGWTGEVSFPPYMTKTMYTYYPAAYSTGTGASPAAYGNENLRWQRTQNFDLNLQFGAFQNRLSLTTRCYYKLTHDLVTDIIVPPSTGFSSYTANLGALENKGYEVIANGEFIHTPNWSVGLSVRLAGNRNRIKEISESLRKYNDEADTKQGTSPLTRYKEGKPIDAIYAVRSLGIDPETGREILIKKDGSLTFDYDVKDLVPTGTASPNMSGFVGPNIRYRGVTLDVLFYVSLGSQAFNQTLVDKVENSDPHFNVDSRVLSDRWKQPGDIALYKDIANPDPTRITSRFVQDNTILELYAANLSYETPPQITKKLHLSGLRFSLTANNVWRWSTMTMERGIQYPFARTVTLSVNITF